jgi:hypothetical protein
MDSKLKVFDEIIALQDRLLSCDELAEFTSIKSGTIKWIYYGSKDVEQESRVARSHSLSTTSRAKFIPPPPPPKNKKKK